MRGILDYFSVSEEYSDLNDIRFENGALFFHSANCEERSNISVDFSTNHPDVELVFIDELENQQIRLLFSGSERVLSLRSAQDAENLTTYLESRPIYIDITGLSHNSWAFIVKAMLLRKHGDFWALYSEPIEYKFNDAPFDGQLFDLSEKINGIGPLAGFARLARYTSESFVFMPLLGFEGARLAHIMEDVQPSRELTFPVIGVPGFKYDFPFYTYQGNRLSLEREGIWKNWRYEKANCPASIYVLGSAILNEFPDKALRIAPIGTKPHALGALILKLIEPIRVDIVYDHPIRKTGRTKGKSKTLAYCLNPFAEFVVKR